MSSQRTEKHPCMAKLEALRERVKKNMQINEDANCLNKYRLHFEITQPSNLVGGTLQQHQLEALEWMVNLATQQSNGILADDMGLGKTIQAISYLAYLREQSGVRGKHLVVCPKSVSSNWVREIGKWFPEAHVELLQHTQLEKAKFFNKVLKPKKFDVLVGTYQGVKNTIYKLSRIKWEALIVDEAHKIKNFEGQNFQCLNYLTATFKLLLTGTPLNNNLTELWTLLTFIMPTIFNDPALFSEIEEAVETLEGSEEEKLEFRVKVAKYFHGIIHPYFKRRSKKDLELGLPPKTERTLFVPLSKLQLQLYKNYLRCGSVYGSGAIMNRSQMVPRKICLHPYLFEDIWPEDQPDFGQHCIESCGKLKVVDKLLEKLLGEGHKVLFFSQFTIFLDFMEEFCLYRGIRYCRLDGSTPLSQRDQLTHDFNNSSKYQLFLLSTRAGGLGINLTGADRVIIYDIDWNPQNDIQAMDRAYRIGQTRPVQVYKLITEFTIEERISDFQRYKLVWDQLVIQKGGFMSRKKEDPFREVNLNSLQNIGKGDIFRLVPEENDKTIEQILQLAEEKNKKKEEEIRKRIQETLDLNVSKINPFAEEEEDDTRPQTSEEPLLIIRKRLHEDKRERTKFERNNPLPYHKFYIKGQLIRDLQFEIHMELKKQPADRNTELLSHLRQLLLEAQEQGRFHHWTEEEFQLFVKAHNAFLKGDYQNIAEVIKTKTPEEVEAYSTYFFEKAPNNQRFEETLSKIRWGQVYVKNKLKQKTQFQTDSVLVPESSNEGDSDLHKTEKQLMKEIALMERVQKQKQREEMKTHKEQEQQRKKEEAQKKKEEEQQRRLEAQELKREEKQKKAEAYQKMLEERKEKKEREMREREERKRKREEEQTQRREEKQRKLDEKKTKSLQREGELIVKKIERDSLSSSKTKSSHDSKTTQNKEEFLQIINSSSLEIVIAQDNN